MKNSKYTIAVICFVLACIGCSDNNFQDELFIDPRAAFAIDKNEYDVFESVYFTNKGEGQNYVVYTGDKVDNNGKILSHVYGEQGAQGFSTASNGTFSYSYLDPGTYNVVWIASSIKANGDIVTSIDSTKVTVVAGNSGLLSFSITRLLKLSEYGSDVFYTSYGEFVGKSAIKCPVPYSAFTSAIKRAVGVSFNLESNFASLYWNDGNEEYKLESGSTRKVLNFFDGEGLTPQKLQVRTTTGDAQDYEIAVVLIPEFTSFMINGVKAAFSRNLSAYNKYYGEIKLPEGTSKETLKPSFIVMANNPNLVSTPNAVVVKVNGEVQTTDINMIDFSSPVEYEISYTVEGSNGQKYEHSSFYVITVK